MEPQEQHRTLELTLLLQAAKLLSESLDPQEVVDRLAELMGKASGAALVSLFTFEDSQVRRVAVYGPWLDADLLSLFPVDDVADWSRFPITRSLRESERPVTGPIEGENFPPVVRQALGKAGISTFAAVPLRQRGRVIGAAYVYLRAPNGPVDRTTLALLQGLADHAAVALERARLHQALKAYADGLERQVAVQTEALTHRNRELATLNEVLATVNASLGLEVMLTAVAQCLQASLGAQECSLYVFREKGEPFRVAVAVDASAPRLFPPAAIEPESTLWQRLQESNGVLFGDALGEWVAGRDREECQVLWSLRAWGKVLGVGLMRLDSARLTGLREEFWRTLGDQLGLAVQNARLYDATREQAMRLRILLDIGRELSRSFELEDVLHRVVTLIRHYITDVHNCAISLLEENGQVLHNAVGWCAKPDYHLRSPDARVPLNETFCSRQALESGQPVAVADLWEEPGVPQALRDRCRQAGLRALLYVPIPGKEGPTGLIHINIFESPRFFLPHEIELLQGIASQLGLALENVRLMQALQRRIQELDAFTYTVSHDLKAPLSILQGYAEVMLDDYRDVLDAQAQMYLERISSNIQTMAQMIDELLLLSRIERDEYPPEPIQVAQVVESVLAQLEEKIVQRGVEIVLPDTWPTVVGQAIWLEQVFVNLIGNAIKFMDDEQPDPCIELGWERRQEGVVFWVRDNGVGIAPEDQARVFELFTRLRTVRREGTGLGLTIVHRVVARAGGRVWVESALGQGSCFYFLWPAVL